MCIVIFSKSCIGSALTNSFKYSFVSFGRVSDFVNNIGAALEFLPKDQAKGAAESPSTNASPFTNTMLPSWATDVKSACSLAILTAVSYLLAPANTPTLNFFAFIQDSSISASFLFNPLTVIVFITLVGLLEFLSVTFILNPYIPGSKLVTSA